MRRRFPPIPTFPRRGEGASHPVSARLRAELGAYVVKGSGGHYRSLGGNAPRFGAALVVGSELASQQAIAPPPRHRRGDATHQP
ncbi:MAG TPA: hypothetical protein VNP04_22000 [Alphaproteobacteria bacterium]|nr:hypothetical protein [Alphaproteobacteria bacterium]